MTTDIFMTKDGDFSFGQQAVDEDGFLLYYIQNHFGGQPEITNDPSIGTIPVRDVKLVEGEEKDLQVIRHRLQTENPDWSLYPEIGANLSDLIGEPNNETTAEKAKEMIEESLTRDGAFTSEELTINTIPVGPRTLLFDIHLDRPSGILQYAGTLDLQMGIWNSFEEESKEEVEKESPFLIKSPHLQKVPRWISEYGKFLQNSTRNTGNVSINNLGLVGGSFVIDDAITSYTPPTTSSSEAQILVIRGCLRSYIATKNTEWLERAEFLTNALLTYYYPSSTIPETPDEKWIPHWLVNVTKPFTSREYFLNGAATFKNGVATVNYPKVFKIFSVRALDATLEYDWSPAAPVIGKEYEIKGTEVSYGNSKAIITLSDKTFNGQALLSYTSETGAIIEVGDKCEAFPMWRLLNEGEIACAIDTLPWAIDIFELWYSITNDKKWKQAIESTKLSIRTASDVTNIESYLKAGKNDEPTLSKGITNFSEKSPKETYVNKDGLISINYPQATGEASFGTWVGNRIPFQKEKHLEIRVGSNLPKKITIYLDEDELYDADKRWKSDIWLKGEGVSKERLETISLYPDDFYKTDNIFWGNGYEKNGEGGAINSTNSSVTSETIINDIDGKIRKYKEIKLIRGDEGGWMGWSQFMFSVFDKTLPFNIKYKTVSGVNFIINDGSGAKWQYLLPKTGSGFSDIQLIPELFSSETPGAKMENLKNNMSYESILLDAIDNTSTISIDYMGQKELIDKKYYSSVSFSYAQPEALEVAMEYLKPAPSRDVLPYSPYILPFDFHLINYEASKLRGAIYTGYQSPWVFEEGVFPNEKQAVEINLQFLKDSQDEYNERTGRKGFFTPIFWWDYSNDYGDHEPNTFDWDSEDTWGGFQYRTISDVARIFKYDANNQKAWSIFSEFLKAMDLYWKDTSSTFPTVFNSTEVPHSNQNDAQMVANFMKSLIFSTKSNLSTDLEKSLILKMIEKCLEWFNHYQIPIETNFTNSEVEGTFSPNPKENTWFGYWGGEVLDSLALLLEFSKEVKR